MLGYGAYTVYPLVASWWYALLDWPGFALRGTFIGLGNFERLLADDLFWNAFRNSLRVHDHRRAAPGRLALLLALVLNSRRTPFRGFFRTLFFLPVVTTGAIIGVVFTLHPRRGRPGQPGADQLALLESPGRTSPPTPAPRCYAGIAVWVWKWLGITMIYWLAALQTIPQERARGRDDRRGRCRRSSGTSRCRCSCRSWSSSR